MSGATDPRDPFNVEFDEAWIASARRSERSAEQRQADAVAARAAARRQARQARRGRLRRLVRRTAVAIVVVGVVGGGLLAIRHFGESTDSFQLTSPYRGNGFPTPTVGEGHRLADAVEPVPGGGPYAFVSTQDEDSDDPVTYDPCRPIRVVVDPLGAPDNWESLVRSALIDVSTATGLTIGLDQTPTTDERPTSADREPFQPERYGDRWAPILITWTDPATVPALAAGAADEGADPIGVGGSTSIQADNGRWYFVTGVVYLDAPDLSRLPDAIDRNLATRNVLLHELGHVVGLGHVDDEGQIMYPGGELLEGFGRGDRAGLARVGQAPCAPVL